jgi:hypothetical protein
MRALAVALMLSLTAPAAAAGAPRWYVATDRAADGSATVSGYAFDGLTQVTDGLTLAVVRGGAPVGSDAATGFVQVAAAALVAGDSLVLTDTTTNVVRTVAFAGQPTLTAPACGTSAFAGTRADGTSVDVSAPGVAPVSVFGAGSALGGTFARALTAGTTVKASMARVVDPAFTVFDAVSVVVGACPEVLRTPPADVASPAPAAPAPAPTPTPVAAPAAAAVAPRAPDTLAPAGRATLRPLSARAVFRALRGGTFTSTVAVSEAATISQTLRSGRTVLATAAATTASARTTTLRLTLSASGRRRLAAARTTRLVLTTTLRDAAGNARTLPSRTLVAQR